MEMSCLDLQPSARRSNTRHPGPSKRSHLVDEKGYVDFKPAVPSFAPLLFLGKGLLPQAI